MGTESGRGCSLFVGDGLNADRLPMGEKSVCPNWPNADDASEGRGKAE